MQKLIMFLRDFHSCKVFLQTISFEGKQDFCVTKKSKQSSNFFKFKEKTVSTLLRDLY